MLSPYLEADNLKRLEFDFYKCKKIHRGDNMNNNSSKNCGKGT